MADLLEGLTPEQARDVLMRLGAKGGRIREAVHAEATQMLKLVLKQIDLEEIADAVYFMLDSIDVNDCWARAGGSRDGYTSPEEAAAELIEEELRPFVDQIARYRERGMSNEEAVCCMGTIFGLYRYEHESGSEFRDWCVDVPIGCAAGLLTRWRARAPGAACGAVIDGFIRNRCPDWAEDLLRPARGAPSVGRKPRHGAR